MKEIEWYFDFLSPYAYFGFKKLAELPDKVNVNFRPVLLPALFQHNDTKGPAEIETKRIFTYRHSVWVAKELGIAFRLPPKHPFPPVSVLRLAIALGSLPGPIETIFDHIWQCGKDIGDSEGWSSLMGKLAVSDGESLISRQQVKDELRENTEKAAASGVFGVPTAVIDGQLFWGQDSHAMLLAYLTDPNIFKENEMARAESLPWGTRQKLEKK